MEREPHAIPACGQTRSILGTRDAPIPNDKDPRPDGGRPSTGAGETGGRR